MSANILHAMYRWYDILGPVQGPGSFGDGTGWKGVKEGKKIRIKKVTPQHFFLLIISPINFLLHVTRYTRDSEGAPRKPDRAKLIIACTV